MCKKYREKGLGCNLQIPWHLRDKQRKDLHRKTELVRNKGMRKRRMENHRYQRKGHLKRKEQSGREV